jgi:TolB protein
MNADGSGQTTLIDDKAVMGYRWSPDGESIAVLTEVCEKDCIETTHILWVMRPDGSGLSMLSRDGGIPSWSPDGRSLAFTSRDYEFLIINADGTNARGFLGSNLSSQPAWSPDGTRIAFIDVENNGIWLINPDGSGLVKLTGDTGVPVWSPDGSKLVFSWFHPTPGTGGIGVINRDGSGRSDLTNGFDSDPRWSPDGSRIVFRREFVSGGLNAGSDIFVMNADGSGQTNISNAPGTDDQEPVWAP